MASDAPKPPVVLIADAKGKAAVAESPLLEPLRAAGYAVLALDLRGRGETLGTRAIGRDNNYHFVSHSIMWGQPLAGRRGFDISRAVDYIESRSDLSLEGLVAVGIGDDALPVLLASTADGRISRAVSAGYDLSFASQMIGARKTSREQLLKTWNSSAMSQGKLDDGENHADAGSVIPGVLNVLDLPDLGGLTHGPASAGLRRAESATGGLDGTSSCMADEAFGQDALLVSPGRAADSRIAPVVAEAGPVMANLTRADFLRQLGLGVFSLRSASAAVRPNVLIIVTDDQGYADMSAYPHAAADVSTPNMDRIAAKGLLFTRAYVTAPVCSPSRAGWNTGRYQQRWDLNLGQTPGLPKRARPSRNTSRAPDTLPARSARTTSAAATTRRKDVSTR